ncbi:MAG: MCE family protein [Muribaculaceae bacterium]|nr:MCE family protein [Muribaculaceae bacterium]
MKKVFRKEVLIGVSVLAALAILVFGIDFLKGVNVFKATNYYYVTYDNVAGLAVSAPVTVNGYKVGQVRDIAYQYDNPGHIKVEISLDKELKLPVGTRAVIVTDMLGTATVSLEMANASAYYKVGDEIPGTMASGLMTEVTDNILPSVGNVVPKVDTLLTNANTLIADPSLVASLRRLDNITANLEATTVAINRVLATLPPITSDVKQITTNVTRSTEQLDYLMKHLNELPIDSVVMSLGATLDNLKEVSGQLNSQMSSTNSSLGKLMNDPALYDNLNATISSLDSLFVDIKKNPKRYISIKLL